MRGRRRDDHHHDQAPTGTRVKEGEVVAELDSASLRTCSSTRRSPPSRPKRRSSQAKLVREVAEYAVKEYVEGILKTGHGDLQGRRAAAERRRALHDVVSGRRLGDLRARSGLARLEGGRHARIPGFESQLGCGIVGGRLLPDRSLASMPPSSPPGILDEPLATIHLPPLEERPPAFDLRGAEALGDQRGRSSPGSLVLYRPLPSGISTAGTSLAFLPSSPCRRPSLRDSCSRAAAEPREGSLQRASEGCSWSPTRSPC